jgi:hypothetical protein
MFKDLKNKLSQLNGALQRFNSKSVIGTTLATAQMKKRIFDKGLRADLKPIGKYQTGKRKGRKVQLTNTGALKRAIKVLPTAKGAVIVANGQGEKMFFLNKRYGKIFALSKDEVKIIMDTLKK